MSEDTQETGSPPQDGAGESSNTQQGSADGVTVAPTGPVDPMAGTSIADIATAPHTVGANIAPPPPAGGTPAPGGGYTFGGTQGATPGAQPDANAQNAPASKWQAFEIVNGETVPLETKPEPPPGLHLMERLQALPELAKEEAAELVAEGIQAFKDLDRRTMKVVHRAGQYFKQEV